MKSATKPATEIDSPVAIRIDDAAWEGVARDLDACCRLAVDAVFDATGMPPAQVSLLFTDDAAMRDLNGTYRGRDTATNVLSFPSDQAGLPPGHPAAVHGCYEQHRGQRPSSRHHHATSLGPHRLPLELSVENR